jgi:hypothetical protein
MIKYEVDKEAGRVSASDIPTLDFTPFLPIVKWSKVVDAQKKTCMCTAPVPCRPPQRCGD